MSITCTATDSLSGLLSHTCRNIIGTGYGFNLGANTYSAAATDIAGNVGTNSTGFTVQVTAGSPEISSGGL